MWVNESMDLDDDEDDDWVPGGLWRQVVRRILHRQNGVRTPFWEE